METFIRAKEFYTLLGISKGTFYKLIKKGEIQQGFKLGDRLRAWTKTYVESYLKSVSEGEPDGLQ